jgi:hypothetical protein
MRAAYLAAVIPFTAAVTNDRHNGTQNTDGRKTLARTTRAEFARWKIGLRTALQQSRNLRSKLPRRKRLAQHRHLVRKAGLERLGVRITRYK